MARKPFGVAVLGVLSGLLGVLLTAVLLSLDPGRDTETVFARAAVAMVAAFAFIAAEALIRVRPWFYRASVGLAVACCTAMVAVFMAEIGPEGLIVSLLGLLFAAIVILPLLSYLRWVRDSLAIPAPRAGRVRPWPVPGRTP